MTFAVDASTFELRVDVAAPASASGADLVKALPATHARYVLHDHEFSTRDGRKASKLYCILWTPSGAVGKDNMLYASQRRALDGAFTGIEDAQCSSTTQVAALLGLAALMPDDDEPEWDPDA